MRDNHQADVNVHIIIEWHHSNCQHLRSKECVQMLL